MQLAHVEYVLTKDEALQSSGMDVPFLLEPLLTPANMSLMLLTAFLVVFGITAAARNGAFKKFLRGFRSRAKASEEFLPLIARLSLGSALIGAGATGVLISPVLVGFEGVVAVLELVTGFCLVAGFLTGPAASMSLIFFGAALARDSYLVGNLDFLALALAFFVLGSSRPGVDDLLGVKFLSPIKKLQPYVPLILRLGVGVSMIFLAIYEKFLNPHTAALVVERYHLTDLVSVSASMWVLSAGVIELVVGLMLMCGWRTRFASMLALAVLTSTFFFFQEPVFAHVTLFGILSMILITGGGAVSLDAYVASKRAS